MSSSPPAALPCLPAPPQWVYDAWYRHMTPDREFPAEVRGLLNHMFGELAGRARAVDWRQVMLEQLPDLLTHNIEQYRCARGGWRAGVRAAVPCWLQRVPRPARRCSFTRHLLRPRRLQAQPGGAGPGPAGPAARRQGQGAPA